MGRTHWETVRVRAALCDWLLYVPGGAEALPHCREGEAAQRAAPAGQRGNYTRTRLRLAHALLSAGVRDVADSILSDVRATIEEAEHGEADRRLLDSLTALLAERR